MGSDWMKPKRKKKIINGLRKVRGTNLMVTLGITFRALILLNEVRTKFGDILQCLRRASTTILFF